MSDNLIRAFHDWFTCVSRYDLLCIEGIARALRIYLGKDQATQYKLVLPPGGKEGLLTATVDSEVGTGRNQFQLKLKSVNFRRRGSVLISLARY